MLCCTDKNAVFLIPSFKKSANAYVYEEIKITESFVFEFRAFLFRFLELEVLRLRVFDIFRFPISVASLSSRGSFVFEVGFLHFEFWVHDFRI